MSAATLQAALTALSLLVLFAGGLAFRPAPVFSGNVSGPVCISCHQTRNSVDYMTGTRQVKNQTYTNTGRTEYDQ